VTDPQGNSPIPRDTVVRHVPLTSLSNTVRRAGPPDAPKSSKGSQPVTVNQIRRQQAVKNLRG
jgi:hypothetical protein